MLYSEVWIGLNGLGVVSNKSLNHYFFSKNVSGFEIRGNFAHNLSELFL